MMLAYVVQSGHVRIVTKYPARDSEVVHVDHALASAKLAGELEGWFSVVVENGSYHLGDRLPKPAEWDAWVEKRRSAGAWS